MLDGLRAADHDDDRVGRKPQRTRHEFQAAQAPHRDVADDEVERFATQASERRLSRINRMAFVTLAEKLAQHVSDLRIVVGDQQTHRLSFIIHHPPSLDSISIKQTTVRGQRAAPC